MSDIPTHYHQLPRTTGTDTVYPMGLPLWDAAGKRIVVGDGSTPGGIPQAKQGDDTTYNRKFTAVSINAFNRDWVIVTAQCHIELPQVSPSILQSVRISALADNVAVTLYSETLTTLSKGMTIECVAAAGGDWEIIEANYIPDLTQYLLKEALTFNGDLNTPVSFKLMTYAEYAEYTSVQDPVANAIYYITDTKQVFVNGVSYGADVMVLVETFPAIGAEGKIYWNTATGELKCYTNNAWVDANRATTKSITSESSDYYVPTAKAVYDFVSAKVTERLTPLDSLIVEFKNTNFEATTGHFYICTVDDLHCTLSAGIQGDIIRFMVKGCTNLLIQPGTGTIIDDEDGEGVLLDIENATVTLYRSADGWSVIEY